MQQKEQVLEEIGVLFRTFQYTDLLEEEEKWNR